MPKQTLTPLKASSIFLGFTAYFYLLLFTLLPFLKANLALNPALYWFITGYFLFIPLFLLALSLARREGVKDWRANGRTRNVLPNSTILKTLPLSSAPGSGRSYSGFCLALRPRPCIFTN